MTVDVGEQFVLLGQAAEQVADESLLTRSVGVSVSDSDVLIGIDSGRLKHLLIPMNETTVPDDYTSAGVSLRARRLTVGGATWVFADLCCLKAELDLVFERLVEDVVLRLASDPSSPMRTCRNALDEWRALLRSADQGISRDTMIGLVGELEILRLLTMARPFEALSAWKGPDAAVHDFARSGAALEVKSTSSVDGNFVSVSNLDQLDPAVVDDLHLVVVHLRQDDAAPTLDDRIDQLVAMGLDREALLAKVADAGYVYEAGSREPDRYAVRSVRGWKVGDGFPGLKRSDLSEKRLRGVSAVRYELALDVAPPRLSDKALKELLNGWLGGE